MGRLPMKRVLKWVGLVLVIVIAGGVILGWTSDTDPAAMRAKYSNSASQFVDLGKGLNVHVRDEGNRAGRTLLLVHGSNASLQTWEPWVKRLGKDYRIISLDLPGHGLTGANPSRDYHYAAFVEIVDQVATKLGADRFVIGGNSMGGGVAWHYALAHPEHTDALLLVDAAGAPGWQARKVPIGFRVARMPVVKDLMLYITPRSVIESSLKTSVSNKAVITNAAIDRYWELLRYPGNRQATLDRFALVHNVEPATPALLVGIKVPTLILWGEEDNLIPVSSAKFFADGIKGAKTIIYPGIGHIPMEEAPDRSAADVKAWLETLAKGKLSVNAAATPKSPVS
jgi:pimeloyl-ACP methyl ester carboxylesterase